MTQKNDKKRILARDFDTIQPAFKRPIWLWDTTNGAIIWANGPGVEFWQSRSLENLQNKPLDRALPAWATIQELATKKLPPEGLSTPLTFWMDQDEGQSLQKSVQIIEATAHCRSTDLNGSTNAIVIEILAYRQVKDPIEAPRTKPADQQALEASKPKETLKNIQSNRPIAPMTPIPTLEGEQDVLLTDPKSTEQILSSNQSLEALAARIMARRKELETRTPPTDTQKGTQNFPPLHAVEPPLENDVSDTQNNVPVVASSDLESHANKQSKPVSAMDEADMIYPIDHSAKQDRPPKEQRPQTPLTKTPLSNYYYPRGEAHFDPEGPPSVFETPTSPTDIPSKQVPSNLDLDLLSKQLAKGATPPPAQAGESHDQPSPSQETTSFTPLGQTTAICSLDHIFYADDRFIQHFGYGSIDALKQDGLDWILPGIRPLLMPAFVGTGLSEFETIARNRAGRKFNITLQASLYDHKDLEHPVEEQTLLSLHISEKAQDMPPLQSDEQALPTGPANLPIFQDDTVAQDDNVPILATVSHELRTPLNVIVGFCEMIQTQQFGALNHPRYESYIDDIHISAKDAVDLINSILEMAKLHANQYEFEPQELDLNQIIRSELHVLRSLADQSNIILRSDCQENLQPLMSDKRGIKMIISNLLTNAIKYNRPNGTVKISTNQNHPDRLTLDIVDTGQGLSEKELAQVLQPFARLDRTKKGTGLGLPLTKAMCEAIGAQFKISSAKDKGTSVHITFPRTQDHIDK